MLRKALLIALLVCASCLTGGRVAAEWATSVMDLWKPPGKAIKLGDDGPFLSGTFEFNVPGRLLVEYDWPSPADHSSRLVYVHNVTPNPGFAQIEVWKVVNNQATRLVDRMYYLKPGERVFMGGETFTPGGITFRFKMVSSSIKTSP